MKLISELPYSVKEIDTAWIPLSDGTRLAARLWLPNNGQAEPVPAILEYLPYRRMDGTAVQDSINYRYLAGHGYAGVRVDIRGTGDSDGVIRDEYSEAELEDGVEVIAWIAAQPWCSGSVGMWGYSWGGFNSLQIAARRPPALKAIIVLHASDDRYTDDCHYMGGCLLDENVEWGNEFLSNCTRPPDPLVVGERWRAMWQERLDELDIAFGPWLRHQSRDDYWKRGSISEDYGQIHAAVYAVGGWADGYTNAVLRLIEHLPGPRKGLIGPWAHAYPHQALPGPAIGFLKEAMRWWDYWLNGTNNGIMDDPMVRVWMQESIPPSTTRQHWPGRWVAENQWPSPNIRLRPMAVEAVGRRSDRALMLEHPQTVGMKGAKWCPYGLSTDMADDQRGDDAFSLCFETAELEEPFEILGAPTVRLELAVNRPRAFLAVRLNDVAPSGAATRVTYGLLNLAYRDGYDRPNLLKPGKRYAITVKLNDIAHAFPPGHRLRVAVSTSYWPVVWPSPEPVTLTLFPESICLTLPVRAADKSVDATLAPFGEPEGAQPIRVESPSQASQSRQFEHNLATGVTRMVMDWAKGAVRFNDTGLFYDFRGTITNRIDEHDPLSCSIETTMIQVLAREDWSVETRIVTALSSTLHCFRFSASVECFEGTQRVFGRSWDQEIPRPYL